MFGRDLPGGRALADDCTDASASADNPPDARDSARALTGTGGGSRRRAVDAPASAATKTLFARRAHAARREDRDESTRRVAETRGQTQPFDDASLDNKRPASLRTIDESDPFK